MDNLMSKFMWRIENFSQLEDEYLLSSTFVVNENKWILSLHLTGMRGVQYLSLIIWLVDSSGQSVRSKYSISIVNQIDPSKTIKTELESTFKFEGGFGGVSNFMVFSEFYNENQGYLVEDTSLIEADIFVSPSSKDMDSNSSVATDHIECVYVEAKSFLESLPKAPPCITASNPPTCEMPLFIKRDASLVKQILDKLLSYDFDDLADPEHETAMMRYLSALNDDHLYLFSDVQAKEIVNLRASFPQTVQEWRDLVFVKKDMSKHPWSTFEKTKSWLQESVRAEDAIKLEVEELNKEETRLEAQLEAIESMSQHLKEETQEISKQIKIVYSFAKEKASKIEVKQVEANCVNQQLEQRLKSKWAGMRHLFA